jgi:Arc/MetJ family transcription regulator
MWKRVELLVDDDLVEQAIRRHHLADAREAVHLALRTLLGRDDEAEGVQPDDEYDEFSDPHAWERQRLDHTG